MNVVCVASDKPGIGKTALAGVIAAGLVRAGSKVTYFRPGLDEGSADPDTIFVQEVVIGSQGEEQQAAPSPLEAERGEGEISPDDLLRQVENAAQSAVAKGQKLVLEVPSLATSGTDPWQQCLRVAEAVSGEVVAITEYFKGMDSRQLEVTLRPLKGKLRGVLVNLAPRYRAREAMERLAEGAETFGSPLLGVLPEDRTMMATTVGQLAEHLNAQWVLGEEKADELVCHILIGGNIMDWGPTYFGRHDGQAVVVRGDRPDIQLAALSGQTACLVLTGGHQPIPYVHHEAEEHQVPLLVVAGNTLSTSDALGTLQQRATVRHRRKVDRFGQLLAEHGNIQALETVLQ